MNKLHKSYIFCNIYKIIILCNNQIFSQCGSILKNSITKKNKESIFRIKKSIFLIIKKNYFLCSFVTKKSPDAEISRFSLFFIQFVYIAQLQVIVVITLIYICCHYIISINKNASDIYLIQRIVLVIYKIYILNHFWPSAPQ